MDRLDAFNKIADTLAEMDRLSREINKTWNEYIEREDALIFNYPISAELQDIDLETEEHLARAEGYRTNPNQLVYYVQVICGNKLGAALDIVPEFFSHEVIAKAVGVKPEFLTDDRIEEDQELYDVYVDAVLELYKKIDPEIEWNKINRIICEDYEGPNGDYIDEFVIVCPGLIVDRVSEQVLSK